MADSLLNTLLQFQPDAPEIKSRRHYDEAARNFFSHLAGLSASTMTKGADTSNDPLTVRDSAPASEPR